MSAPEVWSAPADGMDRMLGEVTVTRTQEGVEVQLLDAAGHVLHRVTTALAVTCTLHLKMPKLS